LDIVFLELEIGLSPFRGRQSKADGIIGTTVVGEAGED